MTESKKVSLYYIHEDGTRYFRESCANYKDAYSTILRDIDDLGLVFCHLNRDNDDDLVCFPWSRVSKIIYMENN